jgi:hypothetical protein
VIHRQDATAANLTIRHPPSTIHNPQSAIHDPQSTIHDPSSLGVVVVIPP